MTDGAPPGKAGRPSLRAAVMRLSDALLGLARTRLTLASIEYAEERTRIGRQLVLLIAAVGCLLISLLFAGAGVVVYYWDTYRLPAIIAVTATFAFVAVLLLWRRAEVEKLAPTPFSASIAEVDKDRTALARLRVPESDRAPAP